MPGKIGYGILLPELAFIAIQFILIESTSGTGRWDGMGIFFGSIFIIPGLLIANFWVVPIQWGRRSALLFSGLAIPAAIGAVEYLWLWGPSRIRWAINSTIVEPFLWIWLFALLMFMPLLISIVFAVRNRYGNKK